MTDKKTEVDPLTEVWDKLSKTDPRHTKRFKRAGGFEGTALKPIWVERRLTEVFGPCGHGWGVKPPVYTTLPGAHNELLVFCNITGWYLRDGNIYEVHGAGGDKVVRYVPANEKYNRSERWESNDEAYKMAMTDATMNAFKHVGVGADIHMGQFDDAKYVNDLREEIEREEKALSHMPDDECKRLLAKMKTAGVAAEKLQDSYRVNDLRTLNHDQYANAMTRLDKTIADKAKSKTNEQAQGFGKDLENDEIPY